MGFRKSEQKPARRRWRDDRKAVLEFNRSITLIADPDALMASIAARIKELFTPDGVIVLRAVDAGMFTVAFGTGAGSDALNGVHITQRDRLPRWLLTNESALVVGKDPSVFNYLSEVERETLSRLNVRVCVPLLALNRLTGMMLLTSTRADWELNRDDLSLLEMLMSQASIAFENAFLYQQQRERLQRLYRAERLAAAGQLAASVAHEVRNPLTIIRSTVQYLLAEFDMEHPKRELIVGVIAEVDRIDRTVDGLLTLTRGQQFEPERIDIGRLIEQTLLLVRSQAESQGIKMICSVPATELFILGDQSQLKQLFLNLVLNALQAMPGGGQLKAEIGVKGQSERTWAEVTIADTGCGIAAENLDRVFDPFFTTRPGGTGLGLSTSYAVARQHGGELEITSREGEGTAVSVMLPIVR
ncbi:MAG TPA: ATP-binding protein [Blastocatellia bacterium]|nr:ATP-binding protein [Blastocatellia bacterium]